MGAGASTSKVNELSARVEKLEAANKAAGLGPSFSKSASGNATKLVRGNTGRWQVNLERSKTASERLGLSKEGKEVDIDLTYRTWDEIPGEEKGLAEYKRGETGKPWTVIDCHIHLMDFLQKSEGTQSMMKAMNDTQVGKSVVFGMPCCKKWEQQEPCPPLYYQDDNADCYVYAYADQMIADAWTAMPENQRTRFAPCFASFNPTDKYAIAHVERMWNKYPGMWRSVGEVMCRHDDLTTMLQDKECPTANHPGLKPIYEFCVTNDIPIIVHHNSTQMMEEDGTWEYLWEVEEVLNAFPDLKFIWAHAGVSRRVSEPGHHQMCDTMMRKYPNLYLDMSWVVWEDVICDKSGTPRQEWVQVVERNQDKCLIGSDQVGQFEGLLHKEITKYYKLFERLSTTAADKVAYGNCDKLFFEQNNVSPSLKDISKYEEYAQTDPVNNAERLFSKDGHFQRVGKY